MFRTLIRLILIIVVVVGLASFFFGYRFAGKDDIAAPVDRPIGTTGSRGIDTSRARAAGAEIGETVAVGASQAQRALSAARLTAKIKSKMTLDDTVKAAGIDVDTDGSVVTLSGTVDSAAERARALQLARETEGVTSVVDRLRIDGR